MSIWTVVTLPKTALVRPAGLSEPIFWDRNGNGILDSGDDKFEISYAIADQLSKKGACIWGCMRGYPRTEIRKLPVTSLDIRKYGRRIKKLLKTARQQRGWMKKIPSMNRGLCYAYWPGSFTPAAKRVIFKPPFSISTRLYMRGLKRVRKPFRGAMDSRLCRAISVKLIFPRPDVERANLKLQISAGGIAHPVWLSMLFSAYQFKVAANALKGQSEASYKFKGVRLIHLGLHR